MALPKLPYSLDDQVREWKKNRNEFSELQIERKSLPKINPLVWNRKYANYDEIIQHGRGKTVHLLEVEKLIHFFEKYKLSQEIIKLNPWTTIIDQAKFIKSTLMILQHQQPGNRLYNLELERLRLLYQILNN